VNRGLERGTTQNGEDKSHILRSAALEAYFFNLKPAGHFDVFNKVLTVLPFVQTIFLTTGFLGVAEFVGVGLGVVAAVVASLILIVGELKLNPDA
jgi:hypothetical protein